MLVGGYLWTGACGGVSVCGGRVGGAHVDRCMWVAGKKTGKNKVSCPISEGISDGCRGFKFSGSVGSYSRGRSEGEMLAI